MSFQEIQCQDKAVSALQKAYARDKASHAYLFAGPEGVGKYKTAMAWARLLLCDGPVAGTNGLSDGCGWCPSCKALDNGNHPDFQHVYKELKEFTKDGKGKAPPVELPIDVIREFLIDRVSARPSLSGRKVFVVSEAERLNAASQNAILKVLEEPPVYCGIILLCTRMDRLLPTIRSRAQVIRFGPVGEQVILQDLMVRGLDPAKAGYFARVCEGRWGRACALAGLEQAGADLYKTKQDLVRRLAQARPADALDLAALCVDEGKRITKFWEDLEPKTSRTDLGRRSQRIILEVLLSVLADAMKFSLVRREDLVHRDQAGFIGSLASRLGQEGAAARIGDAFEALRWLEASANERLVFERLLLRMTGSGIIPNS